jgi:hypothetical protein
MLSGEQNHQVAEALFGWKWMSWFGIPTHGTPGYPAKCRVREFMSPKVMASKRWLEHFAAFDGAEATGDEALAYSYCSSQGGECVPSYFGSEDYLVLDHVRSTWDRERLKAFTVALAGMWGERGGDERAWLAWGLYELGDYSRAALAVVEPAVLAEVGLW